jgi:predicted alpha/beta hydrolase
MGALIALVLAGVGWGVWKGKIRRQQLLPLLLGLAGAFVAARGSILIGVVAIAIAVTWYRGLTWRLFGTGAKQSEQYSIDKARFLLGVSRYDTAEQIRSHHRALIAQNHPDTGGSAERARELNEARDLLLRDLESKSR